MADSRRGRLIVLCGLPGSGKSTLGRRLAAERQAICLDADDWMEALGTDLWDEATRDRVERLQASLATDLLRAGNLVVIASGTWGRSERDALRERARAAGAAVELRYLDAPLDVLYARVEARGLEERLGGRPITRADMEEWAGIFGPQIPDEEEFALFDPPVL